MGSLWGDAFDVKDAKIKNKNTLNKISKAKTVKTKTKTGKLSTENKLKSIEEEVNKILGVYKSSTQVINDKDTFVEYIDRCIKNNIVAIDTETNNSLDPLTCKLMGLCLYTPGLKNAYVPVNHVNSSTDEKLPNQLTELDIKEQLDRLSNINIIMHNGKFDYEVIKCTCDVDLGLYWDTMIGAKILNENEPAGLKYQYSNKIDPSSKIYSIETFFKGIEYKYVQPEIFALYAATDAYVTYKLYEWQKAEFMKPENKAIYNLFLTVEMPVVKVCADMELTGICLDLDYCDRLQKKYHGLLGDIDARISGELRALEPKIAAWRTTTEATLKPEVNGKFKKSKSEQLSNPPDVNSPTQLAILLYDILKSPVVNKNKPRSTGKAELEKMDFAITKLILERKAFYKMVTSFIDTLPMQVNKKTGRLHAHFNQLGSEENNVVTGRFSCTNPNLQQIPSKNKEIRLMFKASPGHVLVGSDYSAQEPRLLTAYSREPKLLEAFANDRDVYATLGSGVFNNDYWDNMEHHKDGTPNVDGKNRRKKMKTLLLGMMYGMGPNLLAENMKVPISEANKIIDGFYLGFPEAARWIKQTEKDVKVNGYVEDFWGRRRRLPDVLLPEYSVKCNAVDFNPLFGTLGKHENTTLVVKYNKMLNELKKSRNYKNDYQNIKLMAEAENVEIKNNGGFINRALRQSVNARIQGGAATMTKKAMIAIANDSEMKKYGFRLLIGVHDELIGECKEEYANECANRLVYLMKACVPELNVPLKCDPTIEKNWGELDYFSSICEEYAKTGDFSLLCQNHLESMPEYLKEIISI